MEKTIKVIVDTMNNNTRRANYNIDLISKNFDSVTKNFKNISKYLKKHKRALINLSIAELLHLWITYSLNKQVTDLSNKVKKLEENNPKNPTFLEEIENDV